MQKILLTTLFIILTATTYGQKKKDMNNFDSNFVHTVFFWLENPDDSQDRKAFETSLKKFLDHSKYAKTNFIGIPPKASRDVVDGSFTYWMVVTFDSAEAQEKYQTEPAHLLFIDESSPLWTKVIVYDSKGIN